MSQLPTGAQTQPSARTGSAASPFGRIAIRWVYPSAKCSLADDGHHFGRDPSCATVLDGVEVSRRHAVVSCKSTLPLLRDLDSRNGLFVNGVRVREQLLGPGDVVRIGEWLGIAVELAPGATADSLDLREVVAGWYASASLSEQLEPLFRAARSDLPIVVQGETGAGKEGVARAVHAASGRPGPFVALDAGALPEQLVEGELFGYRKGAFTGADRAHPGLFRAAERGTLFLDEVLNLTPVLQAKLLRVLEQREVLPLGESRPVPIDVRIVCAAQESLAEAAEKGRFRSDLVARLDGYTFKLPALREHKEDVFPLFLKFLGERGSELSVEPRFVESLLLYDWPLNVRELLLCVRRLIALEPARPWRRSALPEHMVRWSSASTPSSEPNRPSRAPTDDVEAYRQLVESLRQHQGNLSQAVNALGMTRARAYRLFAAHPDRELSSLRKELGP